MLKPLHVLLEFLCEAAILMFEYTGVIIMIITGIVSIINYIRKKPRTRIMLARGMALALEFKMGGEILRTVGVTAWSDIGKVGGIILLRAALAFLLHWEIKTEEKEEQVKEKAGQAEN